MAAELVELYRVPAERVEIISNWYDPTVFRPLDYQIARRLLRLDPEGRYLLYVGHFKMSRGKIMTEALRSLPSDVTLLVAHHEEDQGQDEGQRANDRRHVEVDLVEAEITDAERREDVGQVGRGRALLGSAFRVEVGHHPVADDDRLDDALGRPAAEGVHELIAAQRPDGSWSSGVKRCHPVYDTCFAILFLTRSTAPMRD